MPKNPEWKFLAPKPLASINIYQPNVAIERLENTTYESRAGSSGVVAVDRSYTLLLAEALVDHTLSNIHSLIFVAFDQEEYLVGPKNKVTALFDLRKINPVSFFDYSDENNEIQFSRVYSSDNAHDAGVLVATLQQFIDNYSPYSIVALTHGGQQNITAFLTELFRNVLGPKAADDAELSNPFESGKINMKAVRQTLKGDQRKPKPRTLVTTDVEEAATFIEEWLPFDYAVPQILTALLEEKSQK